MIFRVTRIINHDIVANVYISAKVILTYNKPPPPLYPQCNAKKSKIRTSFNTHFYGKKSEAVQQIMAAKTTPLILFCLSHIYILTLFTSFFELVKKREGQG